MDGDLGEIPVHPAAEDFPMLGDSELAELAADIKANGLMQPIMLDAAGEQLVDGRNRLAACRVAGVEPHFERLNGQDPERYIVSLNVKRRNLTLQQRAIAAARAWSRARAEGRVETRGGDRKSKAQTARLIKDPRSHFAKLYGVSERYVEMARDLYLDDPVAADGLQTGVVELQKAHRDLMLRLGRQKSQDSRLKTLQQDRPDLAERVGAGALTIDDAVEIAKKDADELKQQRWAATVNLVDIVAAADRDPEHAAEVAQLFDLAVEESKGGEKITPERLERAAAYLSALSVLWRTK